MQRKAVVKILVSALMLLLVLRVVDFTSLTQTLLGISPYTTVIVLVGYLAGQVLSSYKWWIIAKSGSVDVPYIVALRAYFIGMYVNSFGFGTVGGDVTRGILLADSKPLKTEAVTSVIADRAHGLAVLAIIGIVATIVTKGHTIHQLFEYLLYAIAIAIIVGWFMGPKLIEIVVPANSRFREKALSVSGQFPRRTGIVIYITILSVCFHLLQIALHGVMAHGVGAELQWVDLLVAIPFVNILGSLPVSWQGLGVRETAYIFFLSGSLTNEQAVAFGAMWLLAVVTCSAIGGIVAVLTGKLPKRPLRAESVLN